MLKKENHSKANVKKDKENAPENESEKYQDKKIEVMEKDLKRWNEYADHFLKNYNITKTKEDTMVKDLSNVRKIKLIIDFILKEKESLNEKISDLKLSLSDKIGKVKALEFSENKLKIQIDENNKDIDELRKKNKEYIDEKLQNSHSTVMQKLIEEKNIEFENKELELLEAKQKIKNLENEIKTLNKNYWALLPASKV